MSKNGYIDFAKTQIFPQLLLDYLAKDATLKDFVQDFPSADALEKQMELKKDFPHRDALRAVLEKQYRGLDMSEAVRSNITSLTDVHTFSICTAHQPCIFSGPLYFIYKIAHAISLSIECKNRFSGKHFVPVFYVGSEDHDLEEIGTVEAGDRLLHWQTEQQGACGRMTLDDLEFLRENVLLPLNEQVEDEKWLADVLKHAYKAGHTLAQATRIFVNALFGEYGVLILDGDDADLKRLFIPVMKNELLQQTSFHKVNETVAKLKTRHKVQATGREINLFYLSEQSRERIEKSGGHWSTMHSEMNVDEAALMEELETHPERFSPNVILRPLYQESILPNIAFTGGGGELAYWLELKSVFDHYKVPFPVLFLRNSYVFVSAKDVQLMKLLALQHEDLFLPKDTLLRKVLEGFQPIAELTHYRQQLEKMMGEIQDLGNRVDVNLGKSMEAHHVKMQRILERISEKFFRHHKKKEELRVKRLEELLSHLFPGGTLQERYKNLVWLYKYFGRKLIPMLLSASESFESRFYFLKEDNRLT